MYVYNKMIYVIYICPYVCIWVYYMSVYISVCLYSIDLNHFDWITDFVCILLSFFPLLTIECLSDYIVCVRVYMYMYCVIVRKYVFMEFVFISLTKDLQNVWVCLINSVGNLNVYVPLWCIIRLYSIYTYIHTSFKYTYVCACLACYS